MVGEELALSTPQQTTAPFLVMQEWEMLDDRLVIPRGAGTQTPLVQPREQTVSVWSYEQVPPVQVPGAP